MQGVSEPQQIVLDVCRSGGLSAGPSRWPLDRHAISERHRCKLEGFAV